MTGANTRNVHESRKHGIPETETTKETTLTKREPGNELVEEQQEINYITEYTVEKSLERGQGGFMMQGEGNVTQCCETK